MTVEQLDIIDMVAKDDKTNTIILGIADHLDWNNAEAHFQKLMKKIDLYIQYVANGDIKEKYPDYNDQDVELRITFQFQLPDNGKELLKKIQSRIQKLGLPILLKTNQKTF